METMAVARRGGAGLREDEAPRAKPGRGPGRPKVVEGTVSPTTVYLTEELRARIDAARGPASMSQWLREAAEERLARKESGEEPGREEGADA